MAGAAYLAALALLVAGCGREAPSSPPPGGVAGATAAAPSALTNRVWLRTAPDSPLGSMLIFLSDGVLVQDSCWETYRLSRWRADGSATLRWQEDTAEIEATIAALTEAQLTLSLELVGGPSTATYTAATAPYVCPDLPR
jgi:hypothetical protein